MTAYDKINSIAKANNGIVTSSMVRDQGIPSWYLSEMVKKGRIERVARGIYCDASGDYDEYYFFQITNSRCIYSFQSALYLHGMTDRVPYQKEVTVYKGYNSSQISDGTVFHFVKKEIYSMGIVEKPTVFGNAVRVYDKERTICDLIAGRKNVDVEIFSHAMKAYASDPDRDYKKLRVYAGVMKIEKKVDDILAVI